MKIELIALAIAAVCLPAAPALAQEISPINKYAWGENIGFLNFADAGDPPGSQGVFANPSFLQGYIWGENIGWINLGDGSGPYANTNNTNFGINRSSTGILSGFAWGENVGWINFSGGALAVPRRTAKIEGGRFVGFVWGENIGWINLDDPNIFVALACPADLNNDGVLNFFDVSAFLTAYSSGDPIADFTGDGIFNFFDVSAFLSAYSAGCP